MLRALRLGAGLSQERLAELAGLHVRTIRGLEVGRITTPRRSSLDLLARALALDVGAHLRLLVAWGVHETGLPAGRDRPVENSRMHAIEARLSASWDAVQTMAMNELAVIGEDRHIDSRTVQGVILALAERVSSRWVFFDLTDDSIDADRFHLTDLENCRVTAEHVERSGRGKLFHLEMTSPLARGDTCLYRYRADFRSARSDRPATQDHCQEMSGFRRSPASYVLEVRFDARARPQECLQVFQARPTGPIQEVTSLPVTPANTVHLAMANPKPGGHGIAWSWSEPER